MFPYEDLKESARCFGTIFISSFCTSSLAGEPGGFQTCYALLHEPHEPRQPRCCDRGGSCFYQSLEHFQLVLLAVEDCSHLPSKTGPPCCHLCIAGIENHQKNSQKCIEKLQIPFRLNLIIMSPRF